MQYHNYMCPVKSMKTSIPGKIGNGISGHRPDAPDKKKLYHSLFSLVIPIAFQNLMSSLVSASDAIMLGMLDQDSLSAVSLAAQIQFVLSLFFAAIMIGTTILSAQYWGKGDRDAVDDVLGFSTDLAFLVSGIFFAFAFFAPSLLMRIFTDDAGLIAKGSVYLRIVSWSYLLQSVSQIYLCIMKNSSRAMRSTVFSFVSMAMNIFLNAILIFGLFGAPAYGIAGAAAATVISRMAELLLVLAENRRKDTIRLRLSAMFSINRSLFRDFLHYTSPVLANELVWGCGFTMFTVIMGHLGKDAVAANSYANIVKNLISCFCLGIGAGSGIIIGNELGSGELETAKQDGNRLVGLAVLSGALSGVLILCLTPFILSHVGQLTADAQGYLRVMLYICSYYMIGKSVNSTAVAGIFCAGGDTRFGFLCDTITMWFIIIPAGLLAAFVFHLPVLAVYFILNLDEFVKLPFVYRNYRKYKWVNNLTREKQG
jgi:putative MATE family efflux protein